MHGLDEVRALIAAGARPLGPVERPLADAAGHVLAAPVVSDLPLPPHDAAEMDGYAGRYDEIVACGPLPVAFEIAAGDDPPALAPGAVARIYTGAVMPGGADTVVPQERAAAAPGDAVTLLPPSRRGEHVRPRGEVLAAGASVGAAGDLLGPVRTALLAAAGALTARVVPRPRLALVITGAEVVSPGVEPARGQVRDTNRPLLEVLAREARLPLAVRAAADQLDELSAAIERATAAAEIVLTTGGVSVGRHDLVPKVVRQLGGDVLAHRLAIKPGRPLLVARFGERWLLGLPGNPLSCLVGWRLFARPLAEMLAGRADAFDEHPRTALAAEPLGHDGERTWLRPARVTGGERPRLRPLAWRGSHDLAGAVAANALVRLEPHASHPAGGAVAYYPLAWTD